MKSNIFNIINDTCKSNVSVRREPMTSAFTEEIWLLSEVALTGSFYYTYPEGAERSSVNGGDQTPHSLPTALFPFRQPKASVALTVVVTWLSVPSSL